MHGNNTLTFQIQGLNNAFPYSVTQTVIASEDVPLSATLALFPSEPQLTCANAFCAQPINLLNGNTWITQHDYSLPGLGGGITLDRTWNSLWSNNARQTLPISGMFGDSWRSTYEEYLLVSTSNFLTYYTASGDHWFFNYNSATQTYTVVSPPDQRASISYISGTGQYLLTLKTGETRLFNAGGSLVSLTDRNGNTTTLTYDTSYRLTQVKDAANRTVTFNYANSSFPNLVTTAQDSTGTIATYTYLSGLLSNVTYPDGSQFNFAYDSNNLILGVTDAQNKVIESHTYDSNRRGLTSSRANGVEAVSVSYPAAGTTTVTDSAANTTTYGYTSAQAAKYVNAVTGPACSSCYPQTTSTYAYDASGNRTSMVDGNGNTTTYTADGNGNQTSISTTLANGQVATTQWTYNNFAEVLTATDPLGNVTTNSYDPKGPADRHDPVARWRHHACQRHHLHLQHQWHPQNRQRPAQPHFHAGLLPNRPAPDFHRCQQQSHNLHLRRPWQPTEHTGSGERRHQADQVHVRFKEPPHLHHVSRPDRLGYVPL